MNFLQIVNSVLRRLRESEVQTVNETPYSRLVSEFVNDIKTQVEDAYCWNALTETITATTTAGVFSYVLVGSGDRFKMMDAINDTSNIPMKLVNSSLMNIWFLNGGIDSRGAPMYYNFNGVDANGDTIVDVFPPPSDVYELRFNVFLPQPDLELDTDFPLTPYRPIILGAYARALVERGEDAGLSTGEAFKLYQHSLSDAIAIEDARYEDNQIWEAN